MKGKAIAKKLTPIAEGYTSEQEFLQDALHGVRLAICRSYLPETPQTVDGLGDQVRSLFRTVTEMERPECAEQARRRGEIDRLEAGARNRIERRLKSSDFVPSAIKLKRSLALNDDDMAILFLLYGRQVDREIRSLVGEFHSGSGASKGWNIVGSLCGHDREKFDRVSRRLSPDAPLIRWRLLVPAAREFQILRQDLGPIADQKLHLAENVFNYLRGEHHPAANLRHCAQLVTPRPSSSLDFLPDQIAGTIETLVQRYEREILPERTATYHTVPKNGIVLYLAGPARSGHRRVAESVSLRLQKNLLWFDCAAYLEDDLRSQLVLQRAFSDALLLDATLMFDHLDAWVDNAEFLLGQLFRLVDEFPGVVLLCSARALRNDRVCNTKIGFRLSLDTPSIELREHAWSTELKAHAPFFDASVDVPGLARYHPFHVESISGAVMAAIDQRIIDGADLPADQAELLEACRKMMNHQLSYIAIRIEARPDWHTLILPPETKSILREIVAYARQRSRAYEEWGFSSRISLGRGVGCLFHGEPGTGKSMAAGIIARKLNKELYKVNISQILSRYVGETEKNLDRVFDEARESSSIILFDEADALFGKRHSEMKSATDRYANMEVNYLLSKLEEFEGIVILTTNKKNTMDSAFMRRLNFRVYFPFPDETFRGKLWRSMLPGTAPVREPIEQQYLAQKYLSLPGGHIKNAVMRAAVMALSDDRPIDTMHLDIAAERECREVGSLWKVEMSLQDYLGDELFTDLYPNRANKPVVDETPATA